MFSSPLGLGRRGSAAVGPKEPSMPHRDTSTIEDPVEEFNYLLDRLNCLIELTNDAYEESQKIPTENGRSSMGFFRRKKKKGKEKDKEKGDSKEDEGKEDKEHENEGNNEEEKAPATPERPKVDDAEKKPPSSPPPQLTSARTSDTKKGEAMFIPIVEEEECIEIIRRVAELVIIGERVMSTQIDKEDKKKKHQQKQGWGDSITEDETLELHSAFHSSLEEGSEAYIGIFDLFFERNGLGLIVDILTGKVFQQQTIAENPKYGEEIPENTQGDSDEKFEDANEHSVSEADDNPDTEGKNETEGNGVTETAQRPCRLLPSVGVATQAVQSVSILIQNVSRATSLFFLLSNNGVNELVDLPLALYSQAERKRLGATPKDTGRRFTTAELAELTTHFVTFLKSLAMRMNTETLQFYLKYPMNPTFDDKDASEETRARAIEFPLYARALDFCAAYHDPFVRITAMNICLNTLRLTTVVPVAGGDIADDDAEGSSPDGVMHNAIALPFRERLAIATHTCAPSRVSRLASPIFTKLSNSWCQVQEKFLELDTPPKEDEVGVSNKRNQPPLDPYKERERKHDAFKDAAATIQDQLLILDDLLKVSLNMLTWCLSSSNTLGSNSTCDILCF